MNDKERFISTQRRIEENWKRDTERARRWFVIIMVTIMFVIVMIDVAVAQEKKWHSDIQYQISPDCSHDVQLYSRRAAAKLSTHSVNFTEGGDSIYVSCEYSNPFQNAISYLAPGTQSQDEELTLGIARTTWYTATKEIIRAQIWIDPVFAPIFGNLEGVVYHEWLHALGEPHVEGGLMSAQAKGNHIDSYTISRLRKRYNKTEASVMDSEGDFYLPCLFVPSALASLVGASEGFYWVRTEKGEIVDYGLSECD